MSTAQPNKKENEAAIQARGFRSRLDLCAPATSTNAGSAAWPLGVREGTGTIQCWWVCARTLRLKRLGLLKIASQEFGERVDASARGLKHASHGC